MTVSLLKRRQRYMVFKKAKKAEMALGGAGHTEGIDEMETDNDSDHAGEPSQVTNEVHATRNLDLPPTSSGRRRRFPAHFTDFLPSRSAPASLLPPRLPSPTLAPPPQSMPQLDLRSEPTPESDLCDRVYFDTELNDFGVFRSYTSTPSYDPDDLVSLDDLCDSSDLATSAVSRVYSTLWAGSRLSAVQGPEHNPFAPFLNATTFRLIEWFYGSGMKSLADLDILVDQVILAEDFSREDLQLFRADRELQRLDNYTGPILSNVDGWTESKVKLHLPCYSHQNESEEHAPAFEVEGIFHRDLIEVIKGAFQDVNGTQFHFVPFKQYWKDPNNPDAPPVRLYSELYNSDAVLEEHEKIWTESRATGCTLETGIAMLMLWSDSTHLASFGNASLWPIYVFFGNITKYVRGKPSAFAAHHLAYMPSIPDKIQEVYTQAFGRPATAEVLAFLKRDLVQAIWGLIMDVKFMAAYADGIVIKCLDGIERRIFPRFFTYSADYPEKVLLASIKNLGRWFCPSCLTEKGQVAALGTKADMQRRQNIRVDNEQRQDKITLVRKWIFEKGDPVGGTAVNRVLEMGSLVPVPNAFSNHLLKHGINFYTLFVPDLLHEFELGVWKHTFAHLLRCLYAQGGDVIQSLNERYRLTPTFGRGTIRRFSNNASSMKKLAARDFEDFLQCAIPVFDGLFPEPHNKVVLDLLFIFATWHAYAKLRLHSERTLTSFEATTTALGKVVRLFSRSTCQVYHTTELPREEAARGRRLARMSLNQSSGIVNETQTPMARGPRRKTYNVPNTYKFHRLGDYPSAIRLFGTSDNYSTQTGELEHRRVKKFYARTNKNKFTRQITQQERRKRVLQGIRARIDARTACQGETHEGVMRADTESLPPTPPGSHYHISPSNREYEDVSRWLTANQGDPALQDFLPRLKEHLLSRILGHNFSGDEYEYNEEERNSIILVHNRIYRHQTLRINYTTYDMRRAQDSINPNSTSDVFVLAHEDDSADPHPFWYARVLGIFHAFVRHSGTQSAPSQACQMDFLWVRWFGRDLTFPSGFNARRLPRIGFVPITDAPCDPFGFLDPNEVIRAVHLIPAFQNGRTHELLPQQSISRHSRENHEDHQYYYVNIFVDRDMFMRYAGGGIGHKSLSNISVITAEQTENMIRCTEDLGNDDNDSPDNVINAADNSDHDTDSGDEQDLMEDEDNDERLHEEDIGEDDEDIEGDEYAPL